MLSRFVIICIFKQVIFEILFFFSSILHLFIQFCLYKLLPIQSNNELIKMFNVMFLAVQEIDGEVEQVEFLNTLFFAFSGTAHFCKQINACRKLAYYSRNSSAV